MMPDAAPLANQIAFSFMSETQLTGISGAPQTYPNDTASEAQARAMIVPIICVMAAAGTVLLALFATKASEPFLLTV